MDADTERDPEEEWGLDQYWRRRAIALAGVLGVVGLTAWACGVFGDGGDDGRRPPVQSMAGAGAAVPSLAATSTVPAPTPTVTVTKTAKATPRPKPSRKDGDACDPRDVVVNMAANGDTFPRGARPAFRLTVVNTGKRPCGYDVGTGRLDVRITSGPDRVWAASACDGGSGSSVQTLRRGIPYVTTVTWDRRRSGSDCTGQRDKALPGTYVAVLKAAGVKPQKQVFHLR
ncbi:hypothetical protein DZF91_12595 [Actinomadura logoneensis]|uniref:DUF4232 domain-containing protein n=1 Tax=Actinomadura logoneensis TaxID=2293572 RepID=A0A372JMV4_9ACTN|nr:hypothetical protein [Actinomadura logoneensis]RFU41290.1 hypothetical protein DZF91_12595 [Actinomadura logoneensis]